MKNAFLLGALIIGMFAACKGGATSEVATDSMIERDHSDIDIVSQYRGTEDVYVDGNQTEYVLIFRSEGCINRMLHEVENDSVAMEDFYVAMDDLGYYYYLCHERLERMGVKFHSTSADKKVFCQGGVAYRPQDSCACGVLMVKPGCRFEFVDLMDFLFGKE